MSADRCFCGAEWNDIAEECVDGHPFGDEERLRVENKGLRGKLAIAQASADRWKQIATDMREERDHARRMLEQVGQMMGGMG